VFLDKVNEYAKEIATSVSPRSTRIMKRQVYEAMFQTLEQAFATSEQEMLLSLQSDDFKEGVAHFLQKRSPSFTGK
jgi:enoyl-CoA hydratase/carnithine racemase